MKEEYEVCRKCKKVLIVKAIEVLNEWHDVGVYCTNEKCDMFEILIV